VSGGKLTTEPPPESNISKEAESKQKIFIKVGYHPVMAVNIYIKGKFR